MICCEACTMCLPFCEFVSEVKDGPLCIVSLFILQTNQAPVTTVQRPMPAHLKVVSQTTVTTTPALEAARTLPLLAPKPANNVNQMAAKCVTGTTSSNAVSHQTDSAVDGQDSRLVNNNNKTPVMENSLDVSQKSNTTPLKVPQFHSSRPSILQVCCSFSVIQGNVVIVKLSVCCNKNKYFSSFI